MEYCFLPERDSVVLMIGEIRFALLERRRMKRCLEENKADTNKGVSGRCCEQGEGFQGKKQRQQGEPYSRAALEIITARRKINQQGSAKCWEHRVM